MIVHYYTELRILGAAYGRADVTKRLNSRVTRRQKLRVSASNRVFGDPWRGVKKTLVVVYQHEGYLPRIRIVREHRTLTIGQRLMGRNLRTQPGRNLRIVGAAYGLVDVTHKVQSLVRNNRLRVAARNNVFGDTWRGVRKSLVVVYRYKNGAYRTKIVTEGRILHIP